MIFGEGYATFGGLDVRQPYFLREEFEALESDSSERRILRALLADAIECYVRYALATKMHPRRLFYDARAWLGGKTTSTVSFQTTCAFLGIKSIDIFDWLETWRWVQVEARRRRIAEGHLHLVPIRGAR